MSVSSRSRARVDAPVVGISSSIADTARLSLAKALVRDDKLELLRHHGHVIPSNMYMSAAQLNDMLARDTSITIPSRMGFSSHIQALINARARGDAQPQVQAQSQPQANIVALDDAKHDDDIVPRDVQRERSVVPAMSHVSSHVSADVHLQHQLAEMKRKIEDLELQKLRSEQMHTNMSQTHAQQGPTSTYDTRGTTRTTHANAAEHEFVKDTRLLTKIDRAIDQMHFINLIPT